MLVVWQLKVVGDETLFARVQEASSTDLPQHQTERINVGHSQRFERSQLEGIVEHFGRHVAASHHFRISAQVQLIVATD